METIRINALFNDYVVEVEVTPSEFEDLRQGRVAVVDDLVIEADENGDLVATTWSWDSDDLMVVD